MVGSILFNLKFYLLNLLRGNNDKPQQEHSALHVQTRDFPNTIGRFNRHIGTFVVVE